jgi:hypothetical protein
MIAKPKTASYLAAFLMVLALSGCQLGSRKDGPPAPPQTADESGYAMPGAAKGTSDKPGTGALAGAPAIERLIVKTAEFRILVETVEGVEPKLQRKVEELGGFIVRAEKTGSGDEASLSFTFRVPAEKFDEAVAAVEALAKRVDYRKIGGEDVTEEYVDLDAQLRNLEATRNRLLGFLEKAVKVEDALEVNRALTDIQGQIERIQGRMKYLKQSAALSTVTVTFYPESKTPVVEEGAWRPAEVARRALRALLGFFKFLANLAIVLAIFAPVWLPLYLLLRWWRKRRRARKAAVAAAKQAAGGA